MKMNDNILASAHKLNVKKVSKQILNNIMTSTETRLWCLLQIYI